MVITIYFIGGDKLGLNLPSSQVKAIVGWFFNSNDSTPIEFVNNVSNYVLNKKKYQLYIL